MESHLFDPNQLKAPVNWLLLDLNSYFASCEQQANPQLRGKPVAVVPLMADTTCAIAASIEAKRYGVKTGTLVKDAKAMCPGIIFIQAHHKRYVELHHQILKAVETCIPIHAVLSIDEMSCELKGSQREIPNAVKLAHQIKQTIYKQVGTELRCSIGLSQNVFLAKVASDLQKPDGLIILNQDNLPQALFPLRVRELPGVGYAMEKRLNQLALYTVRDLYSLSVQEMRTVWGGIVGERMYRWLRGENIELPRGETKSISHQHVLEPAHRSPAKAYFVLKRLIIRAAIRLRKESFFARRLGISVKFTKKEGYWDDSLKFEETQDTILLLKYLDRLWSHLPEEVKREKKIIRVGIVFFDLVQDVQHQYSLFENVKRAELNRSLDRINEKYGKDTIQFASVHDLIAAESSKIAFQRVPDLDELEDPD